MVQDKNKGIQANGITYNHLNLPVEVKFDDNDSKKITYIYDATGTKLQKTVVEPGPSSMTTDYAGNYIYESGSLQFFSHPEGYIEPKDANDLSLGYDHIYQYKDHLGNIRLSYKDVSATSTPSLEIQEENNYYPFGLKHKGYNDNQSAARDHNYGFQEQEENEELGLNWHSYKYRNYDAAIGRFFNVDPLTEDYMAWGPYVFSGNRVIDARELEGLEPFFINFDMTFEENVQTNVNAYSQAAQNLVETAEFVTNPIETVKGVVGILGAMANPGKTGEAIGKNIVQNVVDSQSTDPEVAGPALGNQMSFVAETALGGELASIAKIGQVSKVSKVTNIADDVASSSTSGLKLNKQLASQQQLGEQGTVIAGGDSGTVLRKAEAMAKQYGGDPSDYVKKKSSVHTASDGTTRRIHWEENVKTGQRYNQKTKLIED